MGLILCLGLLSRGEVFWSRCARKGTALDIVKPTTKFLLDLYWPIPSMSVTTSTTTESLNCCFFAIPRSSEVVQAKIPIAPGSISKTTSHDGFPPIDLGDLERYPGSLIDFAFGEPLMRGALFRPFNLKMHWDYPLIVKFSY